MWLPETSGFANVQPVGSQCSLDVGFWEVQPVQVPRVWAKASCISDLEPGDAGRLLTPDGALLPVTPSLFLL